MMNQEVSKMINMLRNIYEGEAWHDAARYIPSGPDRVAQETTAINNSRHCY